MAKAKPIPDLNAEQPYAEAAARIVSVMGAELAEQAQGVLATGDIERVHDMRVATRRLRAALEVFQPCFPKREFKRTLRDVKRLADALGARRDPDVALVAVERAAAALTAADRAGIESFEQELRSEQTSGNSRLEVELTNAVE